jgi:Na+/melibiose symporter-like transporter
MTMVITIVLVNSAVYITSNLLIYFFKYDIGGASWQGNYTLFSTFGGGIQILAMMFFFPILRKFFETLKIFYISVISAIFGYVILLVMALSGVSLVYLFFIPGFFIFGAVGLLNVLVTIFLANTVDYGEIKNNRRDESVIFSMQTFVVKLASGIAALAAAVSLSAFKISESDGTFEAVEGSLLKGLMVYIDNIKESTVSIVSGSSVMGLRVVMTVFPMIVLVIALIIFKMRYNLDDEKLKEITAQIEAKGVTK